MAEDPVDKRLAVRLQHELRGIGSTLDVSDPLGKGYATISNVHRFSQITEYVDPTEGFSVDFWRNGVCLAHGSFKVLRGVATCLNEWFGRHWGVRELSKEYPEVKVSESADAFESGTEVRWTWERYVRRGESDGLQDFIQAAWQHPVLGQLFPYRSLVWICFSRCTGFPYERAGIPVVRALRPGWYQVQERQEGPVIGEGFATEAVRLVALGVAPHIRAAVHGTAEQFKTDEKS